MKNKTRWRYNKLGLSILVLFLITIISLPVMAENGNGNSGVSSPPDYKVSRPVVVIKVTPPASSNNISQSVKLYDSMEDIESQDYLQGNMSVEWLTNNSEGSHSEENDDSGEDLKFEIEDDLTLNKQNSESSFGFTSSNNSENVISPNYILVKRNSDSNYKSLDKRVEVLNRNSNKSELEFRLDSNIFNDYNWKNIEAGVYTGQITPNIGLPGNSNKRLKIIVIVESVVNIEIPEELNLTVEKPVEDESAAIEWRVKTNNNNIRIEFESEGIKLEDTEERNIDEEHIDYKEFFRYYVENDSVNSKHEFVPGGNSEVNCIDGELKLRYSPNDYGDEEWYELMAGKYKDTVTITVTGN
ncbi:MAG TPA: hypothetical protein VKN64_08485 [Halanaerobiales bacterium]|nr:hypothetical protein [Halanaerobiales bacterium]